MAHRHEQRTARTVVRWWQRADWNKPLVAVVAVLHVWAAITLTLAPHSQLFTQGTRPVFALFPPTAWAAAFMLGGISAGLLTARVSGPRQVATWFFVAPVQVVWLSASILAVTHGGGSAMGVVFLSAVLAFTAITALRVAIDFTSGKR